MNEIDRTCPFCGQRNLMVKVEERAFLECEDCGARGPSEEATGDSEIDEDQAIYRWNLRSGA